MSVKELKTDHPRIRGEHSSPTSTRKTTTGSSPHTRGAQMADAHVSRHGQDHPRIRGEHHGSKRGEAEECRIIPAYAGSTRISRDPCGASRDHPRIRGEHAAFASQVAKTKGSSPHTRGARFFGGVLLDAAGIIPAYAGSTPRRPGRRPSGSDHPRIRGEHRMLSPGGVFSAGSSPHTRGARERIFRWSRRTGIIPAYAGSTTNYAGQSMTLRDHPRIRGEHSRAPTTTSD